jgi:hypothetical protein
VNRNDTLLKPSTIPVSDLIGGEYIPARDGKVEFTLPAPFDGKLGLVFYESLFDDVRISVFYRKEDAGIAGY